MGSPTRHEPLSEADIAADARAERLARRVRALERQLQHRIAQVDDLRNRLDQASGEQRLAALEGKAAEYDALMATFTMRALGPLRASYGALRRRWRHSADHPRGR